MNATERRVEDLESVLGVIPHELESRILRHSERDTQNHVSAGRSVVLSLRETNTRWAGRNRDRPDFVRPRAGRGCRWLGGWYLATPV
jgi:hypothetical protein